MGHKCGCSPKWQLQKRFDLCISRAIQKMHHDFWKSQMTLVIAKLLILLAFILTYFLF